MSTIAALLPLLGETGIKPWYEGMRGVNLEQLSGQQVQTGLIELQRQKQAQAAEALAMQYVQAHPESILGNLQGAPGGPPGMPPAPGMTQQAFAPGMPPGAPQTVPGGQDLSRFAGVSPQGGGPMPQSIINQLTPTVTPPPQSVIGGLQGQAQPQAPPTQQSQLMDLMRQDPRAAMLVQQQQQAQQDMGMKRQEQRLKIGTATLEYVGQEAQGVSDQASLDTLRSNLQNQGLPQYAAQLPQFYSKEAMAPFIAKAVSVKDSLELQTKDLAAQAAILKARREQANIPNYTGDAKVDARIYSKMQKAGIPLGTMPPQNIVDEAMQEQEGSSTRIAESTGAAAEARKPLGETQTLRFNTLTQAEDTVKKLATEFTPEERARFVGQGGMSMTAERLKQLYADVTGGKADPKFARFAALVALAKAEAFSTAGKALTETEAGVVYGYIPSGKEYSAEEFEQKLKLAQERVPAMLDRELKLATTPRSELPGMRARGELGASTGAAQPPAAGIRLLGDADLQDLAEQRSTAMGRRVTVEEVKHDIENDPEKKKRFRVR